MTGALEGPFSGDDRGVSELVGFVIVFGIIISSVGVLYVTGFSAMGDYQEHEQTKNAERALDAFAENVNDMVQTNGITYRAGELNLRQGTITTTNGGTTLAVTNASQTTWVNSSGSFSYEHEGTTIVYEGGAIVRSNDNGDWAVREPPIRCTSDVAIVSLVELQGDETAVMSHGSREIVATQRGTDVESFDGNVSIFVDSPRQAAWNLTLTSSGWEPGPGDGEYVCDTNEAVVRKTTILVRYS